MASITLIVEDADGRTLELRQGLNRIGRGAYCDLFIDHASVSFAHCEVALEPEGMMVRDLGSTNGTFIDGVRIRHAPIQVGQTLTVGSVPVRVQVSEIQVIIPEFRAPAVPPVIQTPSGQKVCPHHQQSQAVWKCTRCGQLLCPACLHSLRRRGGKILNLCPDCSGPCEILPEFLVPEKRSFIGLLREKAALLTKPRKRHRR